MVVLYYHCGHDAAAGCGYISVMAMHLLLVLQLMIDYMSFHSRELLNSDMTTWYCYLDTPLACLMGSWYNSTHLM